MQDLWKNYGRLVLGIFFLVCVLALGELVNRPLAFATGIAMPVWGQFELAALYLLLTLLTARFIKINLIHGVLERRTGRPIPTLIGDITGVLVIIVGVGMIMSSVFNKDMTTLVATGGMSMMILGIALRDVIVAAFTGVLINTEQTFKIGDKVKINDKFTGTVVKIGWRTTTLKTWAQELIQIPNLMLSNAVICNENQPTPAAKRGLEILIDYDTSVESAERILLAATLSAEGVKFDAPPSVLAKRMDRDGVLYAIAYTITDYLDGAKADHAIIKSILQRLRDAGIHVSYAKSEVLHSQSRVRIADRSLDRLNLVKQCRLFYELPEAVCQRITDLLITRNYRAKGSIVQAGERRHSLFLIGEGMVKRQRLTRDGNGFVDERFIATEAFGRGALFLGQPHPATVVAETNVLAYELTRVGLATLFAEHPETMRILPATLAKLDVLQSGSQDASNQERLVQLYRGQMEAIHGLGHSDPRGGDVA
ncbi:MAG: mechanosensitive ion channel [Magnetococcales bacterium]|nr:mechanosensitive ion channel [Magnetococcales bacterium]